MNASEIAKLLPHGADMSLLETVTSWDQHHMRCQANSHLDINNPLLVNGELASAALVEYAAQAAAVHAGLLKSKLGEMRPAYIGALRNVEINTPIVPSTSPQLDIEISAGLVNEKGAIYEFAVSAGDKLLVSGRLVLVQPS